MTTMLITFNGARENGQFLGDTLCSIKAAYLLAKNYPCDKVLLALSPSSDLNFLWRKFIETFKVQVIYDTFDPGNVDQRFAAWDKWRAERKIEGIPFDIYKELYRRIDGGNRQGVLCGGREPGIGRKNVFEYWYFGQEEAREPCEGSHHFADDLIHHTVVRPEYDVLIAPLAKCQGNQTFTFQYWDQVVRKLVDVGVRVTVNYNSDFCNDLAGKPNYRKIFPDFKELLSEVVKHKMVCCGNTGVGWLAAAAGIPLLAMQPVDSNIQDYRYEWCGVKSLIDFIEQPDADYCVRRVLNQLQRRVVLTTGCFDIIHAGHVRHLEESRAQGDMLIVALNSDASVKRLKGENRPYHPENERMTVVGALNCVDEVRVFDGDDALPLIHELRPAVITNGCDHNLLEVAGKEFVEQYGGRAYITSGTREQSTTQTFSKVVKEPSTQSLKDVDIVRIVGEAAPLSPNPRSKLKLMADEFLETIALAGAMVDLGAYRGACSLILRKLAPEKELHIFDTWTGNPHNDPLCHHKPGDWSANLEEVKRVVGLDSKTHYHQGVFPATAQNLRERTFCFVMVDPDTYQSVAAAIEFFWPRLVPGGKLFFDDYDWTPCAGVKKAVDEMFAPEARKVWAELYTCVVVKP